jgi:hypothetical protein
MNTMTGADMILLLAAAFFATPLIAIWWNVAQINRRQREEARLRRQDAEVICALDRIR